MPAPAGAADTQVTDVSCLSATSCVADGATVYGTNPKTYRESARTGIGNALGEAGAYRGGSGTWVAK